MIEFDYKYFSNVLGASESSNNYRAENGVAFGKYQFTPKTFNNVLDYLGLLPVTNEKFLNCPDIQEVVYKGYVKMILNYITANGLDYYIDKQTVGKTNKIKVKNNIYGLVAGAWLAGRNGLKNFLEFDEDKADKFGTHISDYVSKFSSEFDKKKI